MSNACRMDIVRKGRGGLISAYDEIADEKRARMSGTARIIRMVKPSLGSVERVSDELTITSILADLRHYCEWKGLVFRRLCTAANVLYLEDKADF